MEDPRLLGSPARITHGGRVYACMAARTGRGQVERKFCPPEYGIFTFGQPHPMRHRWVPWFACHGRRLTWISVAVDGEWTPAGFDRFERLLDKPQSRPTSATDGPLSKPEFRRLAPGVGRSVHHQPRSGRGSGTPPPLSGTRRVDTQQAIQKTDSDESSSDEDPP